MIRRIDRARGMSLIELMVALTIGLVLIYGAIRLYTESRSNISVSESIARLQENARFVLAAMEPDIALANFWGLHNWASAVERRARDADPLTNSVAVDNDCAPAWSIDLDAPVEGQNGAHPGWGCLPVADYKATTDILVVRHAGEEAVPTAAIEAGKIYLRTDQSPRGLLFAGAQPAGFSPQAENHLLSTHAYYIRPFTFLSPDGTPDGIPCLRRLVLADGGAAPAVQDREVMSGVEDMQVQFGVDTDGIAGSSDGSVNLYVDPDNPVLLQPGVRVLSVRVWLLLRSDQLEVGFTDDRRYQYADVDYTVAGRADMPQGFRRLLVSRTVELRNL